MTIDFKQISDQILLSCGIDKTLHIESGNGGLTSALVNLGIDAYGLNISDSKIPFSNLDMLERISKGSILSIPFDDAWFQTIIVTKCLEQLQTKDILKALKEIYRVTTRYVFISLTVNSLTSDDNSPSRQRGWWETKCFEAGFRKHPTYYQVNDYESLNRDGSQICILLEKIPPLSLLSYSLDSLNEERGLHMDMSRDSGERSDAHIIRYQWACNYIKPGDRVLDAACGLGYGGNIVRHLTNADNVVGIDGSDYAIDYAKKNFLSSTGKAEYLSGMLPEALSEFAEGSFDAIISFETLEHVEHPQKLLKEFYRLLTPGGRIIVSVPNDWSDETGEDPNPFHLHVYDWAKLESQLSVHFTIEDAYAQTASQCKVSGEKSIWERKPRSLKQVNLSAHPKVSCEWWLMTAMKSPLEGIMRYEERAFRNISYSEHPSIQYSYFFKNPWLMHAMINSEYRLKNSDALKALANKVIENSQYQTNDYAAALCVKAYKILGQNEECSTEINEILALVHQVTSIPHKNAMSLRWKVSLLFIEAKLQQALGRLEKAKEILIACTKIDVQEFGIHLATKISEAHYLAGKIAYALGSQEEARIQWRAGIEYGKTLLNASLDDILINPNFPNRFNHGDGIREYTVAWDNISRCANGIHLLITSEFLDFSALDNCLQTEYRNVINDIIATRKILTERTNRLEKSEKDIQECACDLIKARQTIAEHTKLLEKYSEDLLNRTNELIATRQTVVDRTEELIATRQTVVDRTEELIATRKELAARNVLLELTTKKLQENEQKITDFFQLSIFKRIFIKRK